MTATIERAEAVLATRVVWKEDAKPPLMLDRKEYDEAMDALAALVEEAKAECVWTYNDDDYWQTECWNAFQLIDGKPSGNYMTYCPYCGRKLAEAATQSKEAADG